MRSTIVCFCNKSNITRTTRLFLGFALLDLQLFMKCFVDYCLSFELRLPSIPYWYFQPFALYMLSWKLLNQGFILVKLKSSLRKCYSRHHDLVDHYVIVVSQITTICFTCRKHSLVLSSFMTYLRFVTILTRRVSLVEQKLLILPEPPVFIEVRVIPSLVVCVCFVDRYLSLCTFSFGHCVVCSSSSIYGF